LGFGLPLAANLAILRKAASMSALVAILLSLSGRPIRRPPQALQIANALPAFGRAGTSRQPAMEATARASRLNRTLARLAVATATRETADASSFRLLGHRFLRARQNPISGARVRLRIVLESDGSGAKIG
jgi:hypothetical protein